MNTTFIKKQSRGKKGLLALLILVLIMGAFAGCSGDQSDDNNEPVAEEDLPQGDLSLTLSIDFPDGSGMEDVDDLPMALPTDGTVLDLIYAWANENNVEITLDGDDPETQYITAIGKAAQTATGGWIFEVNDEMVNTAAGSTVLNDKDEVEFEFMEM